MHHDETVNGGDRFGGAYRDATTDRTESNNFNFGDTIPDMNADNIEDGLFALGSVVGGGVAPLIASKEGLADTVDDFLDDYLLAGGGDLGTWPDGIDGVVEEMEIAEEELLWLKDPGAFGAPTTSASCSCAPAVMTALDDADAFLGGVNARSPQSADSIAAERMGGKEGFLGDGCLPTIDTHGDGHHVHSPAADEVGAHVQSAADGHSPTVRTAAVGISVPTPVFPVPAPEPAATLEAAPSSSETDSGSNLKENLRRQKVARYLEKKKRRVWSKVAPYKSRQRVANARPRHKGRFLPVESDFVPIVELQRRQRALFKQRQEASQQAAPGPTQAGDA